MLPSVTLQLVVGMGLLAPLGADDPVIGRFIGASYGGWTVEGEAFKHGPVSGAMLGKLEIEGVAEGVGVASSEVEGDGPTGTLTSPEFRIQRRYIAFSIGGGDYERFTCVDLVVDGRVVRSATGWRSDRLTPTSWDVEDLAGKTARVRLVDRASGDWGHINVGPIVQTDDPACPPEGVGLLYHESLRPQFHFTARQWTMNRLNPREHQEGWINDLNGLIYADGEYHLFAQRWSSCWLHAISRDLVHWTELEPAFWEEGLDRGVQSGTCVVDTGNTSGLSPDPSKPVMIAFYPRNDNKSQCIAYSLDKGRTWKHYEKNPVLEFPERDPQVFWYAPGGHWVMVLYGNGQYHILTSKNLLEWKDEHHPIPNCFECPDFFELPVDGDASVKKWVLVQGSGQYSVGAFDGKEFKEESPRLTVDFGDFYATQSWHDAPGGRRVQAAWVRGSRFPDMPFNQQVSLPCELTLRETPAGVRMFRRPVAEIAGLHENEQLWGSRELAAGTRLGIAPDGRQFHIKARVRIPDGAALVFHIRGVPVKLTSKSLCWGQDSWQVQEQVRDVEMLVDTASIETFVNDGESSLTKFVLPNESGLWVGGEGGAVRIEEMRVWRVGSAWVQN